MQGKLKNFFNQKWVIKSMQGLIVLAGTGAFIFSDVYETKVQQLDGGYGKKQLFVLILYKMDMFIGKTGVVSILLGISAILFFLAFKNFQKEK